LFYVLLFGVISWCCFSLAGCSAVIKPMTADAMVGQMQRQPNLEFEKSTSIHSRGRKDDRFWFKAGADTKGELDINHFPEEQRINYHAKFESTGIPAILDAQGNVITAMTPGRLGDQQLVLAQQQIVSNAEIEKLKIYAGAFQSVAPLLAAAFTPGPRPPQAPPVDPALLAGVDPRILELLMQAGIVPRPVPVAVTPPVTP
jgi:hypothetical protein